MTGAAPSLPQIRAEINALDEHLIELIAQRQRWVEEAGRAKAGQPTDAVRAPARVEEIIARVREIAEQVGASPEVVERTYQAMIAAFIDLELGVHTRTH